MKEKTRGNEALKWYLGSREKVVVPDKFDVVLCGRYKCREEQFFWCKGCKSR